MQVLEINSSEDHAPGLDAVGRLMFVSTSDLQVDFPVGNGKNTSLRTAAQRIAQRLLE
jgi:hypothetical protein